MTLSWSAPCLLPSCGLPLPCARGFTPEELQRLRDGCAHAVSVAIEPCGAARASVPASAPPCVQVAAAAPHAPAGWNPEAAASSSAAPEVLLGVVASDVRLAVRSLRDYCQALGLPFQVGLAGRMWG